ncbi:MAG: hypothetical protein LBL13_08205 [Bacteroidales bacterium]|jgi:tetratricopeptide (TPR) repeat protein|nr:hypothetical protein [Bacteroidales bacterium]
MLKNLKQMQSHADYGKSAMETGDHSKNGASPKRLTSRGNEYLLWGILVVMPIIGFAQNGDCNFSQETIDYLNKGFEYDSLSNASSYYQIDYKIKAINSFYKAKGNTPHCEMILQQLSVWLVECGLLESKEERINDAIQSFEYAIEESTALLSLPINAEVRRETVQRISQAETDLVKLRMIREDIKKAEEERRLAEIFRKIAEEEEKETHPFITLGVGYGISYASKAGLNASIYMHPNGLIITGSLSFDKGWNIGGGYSYGSRRSNGHIKFLYGKVYEDRLGYMGVGGNFDFYKDIFGVNVDFGLGGNLDTMNEPSFLGSIGLYIKI